MVDFYLITGFLGAGKTTFLKNLIQLFSDRRMRVIINEFGREGVDGKLLAELGIAVDEISNGSIFCSCRLDKFEEALETALADPPELLLVEASGLSDPTNIRKILAGDARFSAISFRGSICLADAISLKKVIHTARVCARQISVSDLVLINKTDIATREQIEETERIIRSSYPEAAIRRTHHGIIEREWLDELRPAKGAPESAPETRDITLQKASIHIKDTMGKYRLEQFVKMFIDDTYRVKGFARFDGQDFLVDCVGAMVSVTPYAIPDGACVNTIVALAGAGMSLKKSVVKAVEWYPEFVISVE